MGFTKAVKHQARLRMGILGPANGGKTYSALAIASGLCATGKQVALIDTEHGSASLYADDFDFDVEGLSPPFHPQNYIDKIKEAEKDGTYDVAIIDSLSHGWMAEGGVLDIVDAAAKRSKSGNSYMAWREGTSYQNALVEAMLQSPLHIIATIRTKMEYVQEKDGNGKTVIRKVGLQPVQREGMEYEFTIVGDMNQDHDMVITKSRCSELSDRVFKKPGAELGRQLREWLMSGAPIIGHTETNNDDVF